MGASMSDETESTEDALRRIAGKCMELEEWKRRYAEASELWDALEAEEGQMVVSAVLIGKLMKLEGNEEDKIPTVSISATDDVDWMTQLGIIDAAYDFVHSDPWRSRD